MYVLHIDMCIPKYNLFCLYNVICLYCFRDEIMFLDKQLVCSSLGNMTSPTPSSPLSPYTSIFNVFSSSGVLFGDAMRLVSQLPGCWDVSRLCCTCLLPLAGRCHQDVLTCLWSCEPK